MATVTFSPAVGGDGSTVTDDSNATTGLANSGHRTRFVPALSQVVSVASNTVTKATEAAASASAAATSAASAVSAPGSNATSATSTLVATGSKVFTTQSGKSFVVGSFVVVASAATPTTHMFGAITAYSGTSLTVSVSQISGSGTLADWVISLSGPVLTIAPLNEIRSADVASAATVDLDAVSGNLVHITGVTTITGITLAAGRSRTVVFDGVLTLSNNATLMLPGGVGITTAVGDAAVISGDTGVVRVVSYTRASASQGQVLRSTRTANVQLVGADRGNIIDITSGTFTQTFTSASTLGNGWSVYLRNNGTGDITIPSSDSLTNWVMYSGESRLFQCNGSAFTSVVLSPFSKVYTVSGTFIKPPGYSAFSGEIIGGGSSGGKFTTAAVTGGGSGGCFPFNVPAGLLAATESVSVAAGVAGVTTADTLGVGGNGSSLGTLLVMPSRGEATAGGAIAGLGSSNSPIGFEAMTNLGSNGGTVALYGGAHPGDGTVNGGSSIFGGGSGGSMNSGSSVARLGGTSKFAGAGGASAATTIGIDGVAPGGGGGATRTGATSGAGARGEVRIRGA